MRWAVLTIREGFKLTELWAEHFYSRFLQQASDCIRYEQHYNVLKHIFTNA